MKQVDGVTRRIDWPTTSISYCSPDGSDRDIVIIRGIRPNMRWRGFWCRDRRYRPRPRCGVDGDARCVARRHPHTRPVPVTGAAYSSESATRYNLAESRYEGPTGITGVLQDLFVQEGCRHCRSGLRYRTTYPPRPTRRRPSRYCGASRRSSTSRCRWGRCRSSPTRERSVTEMTEDDDEIAEYVRGLEERGDAEEDNPTS